MSRRPSRLLAPFKLALPLLLVLSACGGDGGDVPASGSITLSGTAATGAAMSGAAIAVTCASGSGTATAANNGDYSLTLAGTLPCVLTATSSDSLTVLHSVAAGTGAPAGVVRSNITPLSELLVAKLSGVDPAAFAASFNSASVIAPASVATAQTEVLTALTTAGINVTSVADILSGSVAAGTSVGYDGVLDTLQAVLEDANVSLRTLSDVVASSSGATSAAGTSLVEVALQPANTDCGALKSGVHRLIDVTHKTSSKVTIDAVALTVTTDAGTRDLARNAQCDFTVNDGTRLLVSKSGLALWLKGTGSSGTMSISMPQQTLDVAAVAGRYNRGSYSSGPSEFGDFGEVVFDATGQNTVGVNCTAGVGTCVEDLGSKGRLQVDADGGFDYVESGETVARLFAFRTVQGKTVMMALEDSSTFTVFTPQTALTPPAVSTATAFWQSSQSGTGTAALSSDANTVTAVETSTGVVTRQFTDQHTDTLRYNQPFAGLRYRQTNDCSTSSCNGVVQQPVPGAGFVVAVSSDPTKHFLTVSVDKP